MKQRQVRKPGPAPAAPSRKPLWPYAVGLFAAAFAGFNAYAPAAHGPFVFDDDYLPFQLPGYDGTLMVWLRGVRPLLMFTYWLNFRAAGADTFSYHLMNVLFHIVASLLVWLILGRLLSKAGVEQARARVLAIFGAALFLLHPVQTESVAYVASRSENLSVMLLLGAFAIFLLRRREAVSWPVSAAVLALFAAAVSAKEHTLMLPALLLLTDWFWNPGAPLRAIRRNWRLYVPMALGAAAGLVVVLRVMSQTLSAGFGLKEMTWYEYFFTQCRAIFVYLRLFLLPYGQTIDYDFPISHTLFERGAIFGLLALLVFTGAAWHYRRRYPLASYGWFVFLVLMAPTSSFIPILDPVAERRLYISMIGLLLITMEGLRRVRMSNAATAGALAAVVLVAAVLTYNRNQVWADRLTLWEDAAQKSPQKWRVQFHLGFAYAEAGRCGEAIAAYRRAAEIKKPGYELLVDWALAYDCAGQPGPALERLRQAAALKPGGHVYSLIGMVYAKQSKWQEALDALAQAQRIEPAYAMTYVYRGGVLLAQNNLKGALEEYRRAVALDPTNEVAKEALLAAEQRAPRM